MAFLIGGANTLADTAFSVDNSCRYNDGDSPTMKKSFSSASRTTYTLSAWIKLGTAGVSGSLFYRHVDDNNYTRVFFESGALKFADVTSGADNWLLITTQLFQDHSAWYHIVIVCETGNGTAGNRQRIYVNGAEVTAFSTETNSATAGQWGVDGDHHVGSKAGSAYHFDGYMAEVVYIDGTVYAASDFGEFNEDSPTIWQPKAVSGLTFGTNGFYCDFEESDNLGNDANGGTDLTEANLAAADQATDTPTNNFATLNPLVSPTSTEPVFSEGNCQIVSQNASSKYFGATATVGLTAGKWYWECKLVSLNNAGSLIGIHTNPAELARNNYDLTGFIAHGYGKKEDTNYRYNTSGSQVIAAYGVSYDDGDIIGVYLDLDNNLIYWAKNGTIMESGAGEAITAVSTTGAWFPTVTDTGTAEATWQLNFGGCSGFDVSSAVSDANGYGNFEYSPNDGGSASFDSAVKNFLAICTKNLGSDGG